MPRVTNVPWQWADHRRGHPRLVNGNVVYVFEHIRPELRDVIALHDESWIVVYGDGPRQSFIRELTSMLQTPPSQIGEDHLFHVVPPH